MVGTWPGLLRRTIGVSAGDLETLRGSITAAGFASGHRLVVGHWPTSPIGPFADIMWRDANDRKHLVASPEAAAYVNGVYPFDHHLHHEVSVRINHDPGRSRRTTMTVDAGIISLELELGWLSIPFPPRPRLMTATIESWVSRAVLGVRTYGVSPTGVEEWYRTRSIRRVVAGRGRIDETDLGPL
ncbi:MAG: hypothetical protein OER95_17035, partial [Acidimicrobiia bacterium]|nr:hypothetical protein [Acidimicrobiia bacterium]